MAAGRECLTKKAICSEGQVTWHTAELVTEQVRCSFKKKVGAWQKGQWH